MTRILLPLLPLIALLAGCGGTEPLASWNEGPPRAAIREWLAAVTDESGPDYIPVAERIAVFDNDGTSWCERPDYTPTTFQVDLARSFAARGAVDATAMPYRAWFESDRDALRAFGWREAYAALNHSYAGIEVTAYRDSARAWLAHKTHSRYGTPYTDLYYAPMLELMELLEANDFQVWIVTGAAQGFVRAYSEQAIGIPPERVIGSWTTPLYRQNEDGSVRLVRGEEQRYNGHENKPANIETRIGRRPVFAAGNSSNDQPMCRYAVTGERRGLALWIHHDDARREYAYGRTEGGLADLCRDHARAYRVSMKNDWNRLYREEAAEEAALTADPR